MNVRLFGSTLIATTESCATVRHPGFKDREDDRWRRLTPDILGDAWELINAGWTKGSWARDSAGNAVNWQDPKATSWCAWGAMFRAFTTKNGPETYGWGDPLQDAAIVLYGISLVEVSESLDVSLGDIERIYALAAATIDDGQSSISAYRC